MPSGDTNLHWKLRACARILLQYQFLGVTAAAAVLLCSLFYGDARGAAMRLFAALIPVAMLLPGLLKVLEFLVRAKLAERRAQVGANMGSDVVQQVRPQRSSFWDVTNLSVITILVFGMSIFLILTGLATLVTRFNPGVLPATVELQLYRTSRDGLMLDGFLLLGIGLVAGIGGVTLLVWAWKRLLRRWESE